MAADRRREVERERNHAEQRVVELSRALEQIAKANPDKTTPILLIRRAKLAMQREED